jgi:2-haloacid dehalogenase
MSIKSLFAFLVPLFIVPFAATAATETREAAKPYYKAVAFDYFVIFNPDSVADVAEKLLPGKGRELTKLWRGKQFEYGFLRSITSRHADFFSVTGDALDYAAESMKLKLSPETRAALMNAYLELAPWPDAIAALKKLRAAGVRIITIANFSAKMLRSNAENAGIANLFDVLLSTEANGTYKPDPKAYGLGTKELKLQKHEIVFAAFGGWDAYGAKSFGYPTYWVNRFSLPVERLGIEADRTSSDIAGLVEFVLNGPGK